jgi:hypothetical protein
MLGAISLSSSTHFPAKLYSNAVNPVVFPFGGFENRRADPEKVDYRMRSKWARLLRYAKVFKDPDESLIDFVRKRGGINKCAGDYARILGRSTRKF